MWRYWPENFSNCSQGSEKCSKNNGNLFWGNGHAGVSVHAQSGKMCTKLGVVQQTILSRLSYVRSFWKRIQWMERYQGCSNKKNWTICACMHMQCSFMCMHNSNFLIAFKQCRIGGSRKWKLLQRVQWIITKISHFCMYTNMHTSMEVRKL